MTKTRGGLLALALLGATVALLPEPAHAQKRSRDVLTRDEIMSSAQRDLDLFEAIQRLKPHFLSGNRASRSLSGGQGILVVYVDGVRQNDLQILKILKAANVEEVRYLSPSKAGSEYGVDHSGGALVIKKYQMESAPPPPSSPPPTA